MSSIVCYLLIDHPNYTNSYRGYTTNLYKRLRQHRGYLSGGAKYTKRFNHCEVLAFVSGFEDKRTAQSFEWYTKKKRVKDFPRITLTGIPRLNRLLSRFWGVNTIEKFQSLAPHLTLHISSRYVDKQALQIFQNIHTNTTSKIFKTLSEHVI